DRVARQAAAVTDRRERDLVLLIGPPRVEAQQLVPAVVNTRLPTHRLVVPAPHVVVAVTVLVIARPVGLAGHVMLARWRLRRVRGPAPTGVAVVARIAEQRRRWLHLEPVPLGGGT